MKPNPMHTIQRSAEEDAFMAAMIFDAQVVDPATSNARLMQARRTKAKLTEEMMNALRNGEPDNSPYVNRLVSRIAVLIKQEAELEALA